MNKEEFLIQIQTFRYGDVQSTIETLHQSPPHDAISLKPIWHKKISTWNNGK